MKSKHNITAIDFTGICLRCKRKLKTNRENKQGYCEECWEKFTDELDAMYEDEWK